jgi:ribosome-associated protein
MHALQDIGEKLTKLNDEQLNQLNLEEKLLEAVKEAKRINKFGALRRQLQYIGRLMREVDVTPIQEKLAVWDGSSKQHTAYLHYLEHWRTRLLEDDKALADLNATYPTIDTQRLKILVRNANKEKEANRPPVKYVRLIFQELRSLIPESTMSSPGQSNAD